MANEFIARKGLISSGSINVSGSITASGFFGTASFASFVEGGKANYIPIWWSSSNALSSSIMYQTGKGIFIGYDTAPHLHSTEGETLAVHSGETGVKNVIYAHGTSNDSYRVNIRNISNGVSASTNFIATTDNGNDLGGYVRLGINSSTYTRTDEIGGALDAYLFTTGSDLLIGTLSPDKRIILFTGPGNATNNARVYIDATGSVAINTSTTDPVNPEALLVTAIANSYNLIVGEANLDNYSQLNITNLNGGVSASADVVATANNGTETSNYIDMGINSDQYGITNAVGGPNDAYVYSTGNMLHIGNATPGQHIMFFAGGLDAEANNKLTLDANNQHILSGSLNVTGSISVQDNVINNLTASHAMTASYVAGAASDWNTLQNKPEGLVSNSAQYPGWVTASSQIQLNAITGTSFSNSAFYFPNNLRVDGTLTAQEINTEYVSSSVIYESGSSKFGDTNDDVMSVTGSIRVLGGNISGSFIGLLSESTQVNYTQLQNIPVDIVSSSTQVKKFLPIGTVSESLQYPGWVTASSQIDYNLIQNKLSGVISSSTQFNALSNTSSSFATTASAANSITFTPSTASFATTASFAQNSRLLNNTSSAIFATTGSNSFNGTQTITGSLLLTTDIVVFTGSFTTSGSFAVSGSLGVSGGITGSLLGSSSFATTASAATSITFIPLSASFATTASAATSITFTPTSASFATTSSYAVTSSFAVSASFIDGGLY